MTFKQKYAKFLLTAGTWLTTNSVLKRFAATFIFAVGGVLIGAPVLGYAVLKPAIGAGIGSVINLAFRMSQKWLQNNPEDV